MEMGSTCGASPGPQMNQKSYNVERATRQVLQGKTLHTLRREHQKIAGQNRLITQDCDKVFGGALVTVEPPTADSSCSGAPDSGTHHGTTRSRCRKIVWPSRRWRRPGMR
ncbi:hypothetical protein EVAR_20770_1 [Eumeta japonica]|uniref:Uncharacterized protein n=1 Tax=Eumeta variegata TaxID=151549 RepID=A0A4C1UES5_EUMVA|nr:hypothetical protein EVAR_20770_1 [Eumeta japonica]